MYQENFVDLVWKKQMEYIARFDDYFNRFKDFREIFNYFQRGQTIAQIACGSINEDLFLTMERVGREGRIILIDEDPLFVYDRTLKILGEGTLPNEKEFYIQTEEGKQFLKGLFSQGNIEVYVQHLPPYPQQIPDESLDHVMAINAAFELMGVRGGSGFEPNVEGIIAETYKKLRKGGSFLVQGIWGDDIEWFGESVDATNIAEGLRFEEDYSLPKSVNNPDFYTPSYWKKWIKRE